MPFLVVYKLAINKHNDLFNNARHLVYVGKHRGTNQVYYYESIIRKSIIIPLWPNIRDILSVLFSPPKNRQSELKPKVCIK